MKHRGLKFLSLLLSLVMVLGLMPGMSLTAYAATYESGSVIISALTIGDILKSGVTVTAADGSSGFRVFINSEEVISDPVKSYTTDKNYSVIEAMDFGGDSWVIDLQPPAHTHSFTYTADGATITATCNGEGTCDITEGLTLTISAPTGNLVYDGTTTYPATLSTGYNTTAFPGTYSISYTKDGSAYSGVPKDAGTYTASVTAGTGDGAKTASVSYTIQSNTFTVTYIANNGTGETKVYTPAVGQTHNVVGQLFPAPQDKEFNNWLGDDGNTYLQGAQINTNRTLTAQWKDKSQGGDSGSGGSDGFVDLVFNIPGADNSWEYVGGYVAPQLAYRVSLAPMQGGSAALGLTTGESGTALNVYPSSTVYVFPNAEQGYVLDKIVWSLIDGSASYDITEAKNFVMPAMDVVVYVTFRPVG